MAAILVAHATDAGERAVRVTEKLAALGYKIEEAETVPGAFPRRQLAGAVDKAQCVLVLWSKDAAVTPGLVAAAARAKAAGKLTLARLDTAAPPIRIRTDAADLSSWMGRDTRAWKSLIAHLPALGPALGKAAAKPAPRAAKVAKTQPPVKKPAKKKGDAGLWIGLGLVAVAAAAAAGVYFFVL